MKTILNETRMNEAKEQGKGGTSQFNCWGCTLFILDISEDLYWVDNEEITKFIDCNTSIIIKPKIGDILVLYVYPDVEWLDEEDVDPDILRISHTAVYVGDGKWFHKRGCNQSEFVTEKEIKEVYYEYEIREYRRIK